MGDDQENAPVIQSNFSSTDTSLSSCSQNKKRKAQVLNHEPLTPREVNESMVKLLFEKKLTYTDIEGKNRIIIPKTYAEIVFPETGTKDIQYLMDDMAAPKVWTFLIRSWSNGSSRIYVLEGAAKYIQDNEIKVGDYIRIYKDREMERFAIGWRKDMDNSLADGVKKVDLPVTSSEVALDEKNALPYASSEADFAGEYAFLDTSSGIDFPDDYHPTFAPDDETYQFSNDNIDPQYVRKNFNMSWDEFQEFNPFDFP